MFSIFNRPEVVFRYDALASGLFKVVFIFTDATPHPIVSVLGLFGSGYEEGEFADPVAVGDSIGGIEFSFGWLGAEGKCGHGEFRCGPVFIVVCTDSGEEVGLEVDDAGVRDAEGFEHVERFERENDGGGVNVLEEEVAEVAGFGRREVGWCGIGRAEGVVRE